MLLGSALLHLLLLALLLRVPRPTPPPEPLPPPSIPMVFETAPGGRHAAPHPQQLPASRAPRPAPPATPRAAPTAPARAQPVPSPPARIGNAHPQTTARPTVPPAVSLTPPPPTASAIPLPAPVPPPARPTPPPRPAAPARPRLAPSFNGPITFSARPPRRHGLDLSPGAAGGFGTMKPAMEATSRQVGGNWLNALHAWLMEHGSYPDEAAENGQQGTVRVRFVVARDGRVLSVRLEQTTASPWLNMAPPAWLRGARLPPLPPGAREDEATVDLTIHFILTR